MSSLPDSLANLDEEAVLSKVEKDLGCGRPAVEILNELRQGMIIVGKRFEQSEYFLSELIMSAEIFKAAAKLLEPEISRVHQRRALGKIVIGTVEGDIHDIGKNIVVTFLESAGFNVYDLGVDVSPMKFVSKVRETKAGILGLSCLLTMGFEPMKATIRKLSELGLRKRVRVIIGGAAGAVVTRDWVRKAGADAFGRDSVEAVKLAKTFVRALRRRRR